MPSSGSVEVRAGEGFCPAQPNSLKANASEIGWPAAMSEVAVP